MNTTITQKFKTLIVLTLFAVAVASVPAAGFAQDNEKHTDTYKKEKDKKENVTARTNADFRFNLKLDGKSKDKDDADKKEIDASARATWWSRLFGNFGTRRAEAEVAVKSRTPSISGITAPTVLKVGETGTWKVEASDPQNGSLTYAVDWGETATLSLARIMGAEPVFVQTSTFTHAYANPGTYRVAFTVSNSAGQKTTSTVTVHITGSPTVAAPVITNVSATSTKARQAKVTWDTDVRATTALWYSTTSPVHTSGKPNISRLGKTLSHQVTLTKLEAGTKYFVIVGSENDGGKTLSSEISFVTPVIVDTNAPVITGITASTTIAAGETETVTINAYDPKNGSLSYSADWGDSGMMMSALKALNITEEPFVQTSTFSHVYSSPGTYTATFTAQNSAGKKASTSVVITVTAERDLTAPVLSTVASVAGTSTSTVSWATNEPATSKVFYSSGSAVDVSASTTPLIFDNALVTSHSFVLSGLATGTPYRFIVGSADASGNSALSSEYGFTTGSGN